MDPHTLTFQPWPDPALEHLDVRPDGTYSRLGWLPLIGPSAWLIWGTVAAQLRHEPTVTWTVGDLATAHGLSRDAGPNGVLARTLTRLTQFHLITLAADAHHLVRITAPPLSARRLDRLPPYVAALHRQTFDTPRSSHG
jgi:hypothetical protein